MSDDTFENLKRRIFVLEDENASLKWEIRQKDVALAQAREREDRLHDIIAALQAERSRRADG